MEVKEIETQLQIVHFSEQNQSFFIQSKKNKIIPPTYATFKITTKQRFAKFHKAILVACMIEKEQRPITLKFLDKQYNEFISQEAHNLKIMNSLVLQAMEIIKG